MAGLRDLENAVMSGDGDIDATSFHPYYANCSKLRHVHYNTSVGVEGKYCIICGFHGSIKRTFKQFSVTTHFKIGITQNCQCNAITNN